MGELDTASQRGTLRVLVDRSRCCGYGLCMQVCPDIFKLDDADGLVQLDCDIVPSGLEKAAAHAVASCPAEALRMVADPQ
jgi:ferredoxin